MRFFKKNLAGASFLYLLLVSPEAKSVGPPIYHNPEVDQCMQKIWDRRNVQGNWVGREQWSGLAKLHGSCLEKVKSTNTRIDKNYLRRACDTEFQKGLLRLCNATTAP